MLPKADRPYYFIRLDGYTAMKREEDMPNTISIDLITVLRKTRPSGIDIFKTSDVNDRNAD